MTITDTCKCGAAFSASSDSHPSAFHCPARAQHDKWLAAHEHCRKYLLVTKTYNPCSDEEEGGEGMTDSQFLVEYRNPDGSLLLPQYGGCAHIGASGARRVDEAGDVDDWRICHKCRTIDPVIPNLATPQGFFDLWEAMKKREDFDDFRCYLYPLGATFINPLAFPALVREYLESL